MGWEALWPSRLKFAETNNKDDKTVSAKVEDDTNTWGCPLNSNYAPA